MRTLVPIVVAVVALIATHRIAPAAAEPVSIPSKYVQPFTPAEKPLQGLVITLDAGHGGPGEAGEFTRGTPGVNSGLSEADLNMRTAALLFHHLQAAGARVWMTRFDDRTAELDPKNREQELALRASLADLSRSHLSLSVNHLGASSPDAHGVVILYWPTDRDGKAQPLEHAMADILRDEVHKSIGQGVRFDHWTEPHPLVTGTDVPALAVEYGFLTNPDFDAWAARPLSAQDEAIATYRAVERIWLEHGDRLEAERKRLFPEEALNPPAPQAAAADPKFPLGKPSSKLWPFDRPVETESEAAFLIGNFRRWQLSDHTTFWLEASLKKRGDEWVLTGASNVPQVREAMVAELGKALGTRPIDELRLLPSAALGDAPFGVVTLPMALTWGMPEEGKAVQTQVLFGEPLFLLDASADEAFFLVHGIDGYLGWLRRDAVKRLTKEEFTALMTSPSGRLRRQYNSGAVTLPAGSLVPLEGELDAPDLHASDPGLGRRVAETALSLLHVPYVFGGRSQLGLDCSGLVGVAWAAEGVQLPRDANQQAMMGRLVAVPWYRDALQPGDALFFVDRTGRVIHAGISLGGSRFVHCSPPEVQVNSFDPADPLYSATWTEAFAFGRRPAE